jgi:hypothetical protein
MAMRIQVVIFLVVMLSSGVVGYQHFGGLFCFHLHPEYHPLNPSYNLLSKLIQNLNITLYTKKEF